MYIYFVKGGEAQVSDVVFRDVGYGGLLVMV